MYTRQACPCVAFLYKFRYNLPNIAEKQSPRRLSSSFNVSRLWCINWNQRAALPLTLESDSRAIYGLPRTSTCSSYYHITVNNRCFSFISRDLAQNQTPTSNCTSRPRESVSLVTSRVLEGSFLPRVEVECEKISETAEKILIQRIFIWIEKKNNEFHPTVCSRGRQASSALLFSTFNKTRYREKLEARGARCVLKCAIWACNTCRNEVYVLSMREKNWEWPFRVAKYRGAVAYRERTSWDEKDESSADSELQ